MSSAIMAFLHHLAAFTLVGVLIYEHTAFRKDLTLAEARRLQRIGCPVRDLRGNSLDCWSPACFVF